MQWVYIESDNYFHNYHLAHSRHPMFAMIMLCVKFKLIIIAEERVKNKTAAGRWALSLCAMLVPLPPLLFNLNSSLGVGACI